MRPIYHFAQRHSVIRTPRFCAMGTALFLLAAALSCVCLASAYHPSEYGCRRAASDAVWLKNKSDLFSARKNSYSASMQRCIANGRARSPKQPALGTPWTLWNQSYSLVGGESYFNLRDYGVPSFSIGPLPFVQLVDADAKIWFNENPLASQLTISNMSMITFDFTLPGQTAATTVCFANLTATYDNQKLAHDSVISYKARTSVEVSSYVGRSNRTVSYNVATAYSVGMANDFGGGNHADMTFSSFSRLSDGVPVYWTFDQPKTDGKTIPGPDPCDHNTGQVGGSYDCTGPDCSAGYFNFDGTLAEFVATYLNPACCTNFDCKQGISPFLPDYNTFVCLN